MGIARILGLAAALAAGPLAAEGRLDTGFGEQGWVVEGFQPDPAGGPVADADVGIVACGAGPARLVATGLASRLTRVVTMFLTPGGELDTTVGFGGKQSFPLPSSAINDVRGLCQADGKPVLAYNLARSADPERPHHEIHVLRIDPATGLPDASFGNGGTLRIDLDLEFGATITQRPLALAAGPEGEVILMGSFEQERRQPADKGGTSLRYEAGFVMRITPDGSIGAAASSYDAGSSARRYLGGGVANGRLRAAGSAGETLTTPARVMESEFTWPDLQRFADTVHPDAPLAVAFSARVVDSQLAVAASIDGAPAALVWRSDGPQRVYRLPVPRIEGVPATIRNAQVAALADGLYYAGSVSRGEAPSEAFYAGKLIGSAGGARIDGRFGDGGMTLSRPVTRCATPPLLGFSRFTFWNGALTAVGVFDSACTPGDSDYDYAVVRLESALFADGLEDRYGVR